MNKRKHRKLEVERSEQFLKVREAELELMKKRHRLEERKFDFEQMRIRIHANDLEEVVKDLIKKMENEKPK